MLQDANNVWLVKFVDKDNNSWPQQLYFTEGQINNWLRLEASFFFGIPGKCNLDPNFWMAHVWTRNIRFQTEFPQRWFIDCVSGSFISLG